MAIVINNARTPNSLRRQLGRTGRRIGRTKSEHRGANTNSRELYIIRRFILWRLEQNDWDYPVEVTHQDSPDFEISEAGLAYGLEFTEAGKTESKANFSRDDLFLVSEMIEGPVTDEVVNEVISDIRDALQRKARKVYSGSNTDLIIYPNSPERMAVGLFGDSENRWNEIILNAEYDVSNFRNVFLFWYENDCRFEIL